MKQVSLLGAASLAALMASMPKAITGLGVQAAVKGKGAQFHLWDSSLQVPALVQVAEVLSITPPRPSRDTIDTTHHGSAGDYREFISNLMDAGEITLSIHYLAGSESDVLLMDALADGDLRTWKIIVNAPNGQRQITGSGLVTEYGPEDVAIDDKMVATLTLKVSGPIVMGPVA